MGTRNPYEPKKKPSPETVAKLNAKVNDAKKATIRKPKCPVHKQEMTYAPHEGLWQCVEATCKKVAIPKDEATTGSRPVIGRGSLECFTVIDKDGQKRTCLRAIGNNVVIDITDYVSRASIDVQHMAHSFAELFLQVPYIYQAEDEGQGKQRSPFEVVGAGTAYINSDGEIGFFTGPIVAETISIGSGAIKTDKLQPWDGN